MSVDTGTRAAPQQAHVAAAFTQAIEDMESAPLGQAIEDIRRAQACLAGYRNQLMVELLVGSQQVTAVPVEVDDFAARTGRIRAQADDLAARARMFLRQAGLHGEALRTILPDAE